MDEDPDPKGFHIKDSRIPITLSLRPIELLRPHEETVGKDLGLIIHDLQVENVLRHPLIADRSTGVILDGTHRLAALKALDCRLVPCALVEYEDPRILVDRWYRIITGSRTDDFLKQAETKIREVKNETQCEECLTHRECYAALEDESFRVFPCKGMTPLKLTQAAFQLEQAAKEIGLKVKYSDAKRGSSSSKRLILSTIRLDKKEIVRSALAGAVFPPKTTRHIIPSRPLGTSTPIELLRSRHLRQAQDEFVQELEARQIKRLPEGSKVGSRRYAEEVFLFV